MQTISSAHIYQLLTLIDAYFYVPAFNIHEEIIRVWIIKISCKTLLRVANWYGTIWYFSYHLQEISLWSLKVN